jgi:hypothetical protein
VLIVNSDIAFYPGVLQRISRAVERQLRRDPLFGIGFTSLCCGSEWSAVVFTRRLVEKIGYMDENFYPAYYEDDDYAIRAYYAGMRAVVFNNTALLHGEIDGSKDYLSGVVASVYLSPGAKKDPAIIRWRKLFEAGVERSRGYINKKWGLALEDFNKKRRKRRGAEDAGKITEIDCKSAAGINGKCRTLFTRPFNDSTRELSHWELDKENRNAILKAAGIPTNK